MRQVWVFPQQKTMSPDTSPSKICPTCGTRVSEDAAKCLVCGADLGSLEKPAQAAKSVQGSRMPAVTISLPAAIGLLALFLAIGAVLVYFALRQKPEVIVPPTPTATVTATTTSTPTDTPLPPPTSTSTPEPSPTPFTYEVQDLDTCIEIAARYEVSLDALTTLNGLPANCNNYILTVGQQLLIPYPTPTSTPLPSATLSLAEQTEAACEKVDHTVQSTDTLSGIAALYDVPMQAIREENGLPGDSVYLGQVLSIPLCRRNATPGPTPTPTLPPPYPAPSLLMPTNGSAFNSGVDTISLQWASVGTLRDIELYQVIIEDITAGLGPTLIQNVTDTRLNVPATIRPTDNIPHIFSWSVSVVRQEGTDENGNPVYASAGAVSVLRYFTWIGSTSTTPSP